ncbi:MAG: MbtH family protein [Acidobacteria bacterium]|nr:MbtH family protein [Acidobacteriota bacterium]
MTNPFEDDNRTYLVLSNDEEQYSLWPTTIDVPAGWTVVHSADTRQACLEYVEQNWTDMRPKTLREASRADNVQ